MNEWTLERCCKEACNRLSELGIDHKGYTVQKWHQLLRANRDRFRVTVTSNRKSRLPELLEYYSDAKDEWISYCITQLADLTHEMARTHLNNVIIPKLLEEDPGEHSSTQAIILQRYKDKPISETTAWRWLRRLGFRYCNRKKSFYVDGHERNDVVLHCNDFTKEYLTKLEPRCFHWIQFTKADVEAMKMAGKIQRIADSC